MFFRQMTEAFFVRTEPTSIIVKPAPIHITRAPHTRNPKVLKTNCASPSMAAHADTGDKTQAISIATMPNLVITQAAELREPLNNRKSWVIIAAFYLLLRWTAATQRESIALCCVRVEIRLKIMPDYTTAENIFLYLL